MHPGLLVVLVAAVALAFTAVTENALRRYAPQTYQRVRAVLLPFGWLLAAVGVLWWIAVALSSATAEYGSVWRGLGALIGLSFAKTPSSAK